MAPASIPAASALQLSFGLIKNLGSGKLLGGGAKLNTVPENFSKSSMATASKLLPPPVDDDKTAEISLGRSLGSGPKRVVEATIKHSEIACVVVFISCFGSSRLVGFDFFGVSDWSLVLLGFLLGGQERPRVREGREWWGLGSGRGRRGGG